MPPVRTRSQVPAGGISKKVNRRPRAAQEPSDSWELLDRQGLDPNEREEALASFEAGDEQDVIANEPVDVDEAVSPLREMADRVGQEVETFAQTLDEFITELPTVTNRFTSTLDLILDFKKIADEKVDELKSKHEQEMREQLKKEWSERTRIPAASTTLQPFTSAGSSSLSAKKAEQVRQLRGWQQEADIWELFRNMLALRPFEADAQAMHEDRQKRLNELGPIHRYTSEGDLWERFLLEKDLARERYMVKNWLEQTADHQASDLQGIVDELEAKAGRGKGLWSSGWMYTREKIKGEKRLRSWPNAAESPLPQIRRSDNNELLATTLDPDAPRRQQRTLEKADTYFERAIWVAYWEMLRRGTPLQDISEWCEERKEGWRALAMGSGLDNMEPESSGAAWRHMCELIAQSANATDYEAAVFGAIGGNLKAMERVCRTVDDHLYAHYTAALVHQFDHYVLSVCPERAAPSTWRRNLANDFPLELEPAQQAVSDLIVRLRRDPPTRGDATEPMKAIQSYLLIDEVGSLIKTLGVAIANTPAVRDSTNTMYFRRHETSSNDGTEGEIEVAMNPQTLRIVAHMALIHRILSPGHLEGDELGEDENVVVAYIQALRTAGKRWLIPTYAARLSKERYISVLGQTLQDITTLQDQRSMLRILQDARMDVVAILQEQLASVMKPLVGSEYVKNPLSILETSSDQQLHPGKRIRVNFLPNKITSAGRAILISLHWFKLLNEGWEVTFKALSLATRKCLVTGRLAAARAIIQEFPHSEVSKEKSYALLSQRVDIMDDSSYSPQNEEEAMVWELMQRQSRTYFELEQLVRAIVMLSEWREIEKECEDAGESPSGDHRAIVERAKKEVSAAIEPLLHGILQNPVDEAEAADLAQIRLTYLPEIILAYNCVLYAAAGLVSRDSLLDSMDLSTIIANDKTDGEPDAVSNGLAECFVKAGRMRELVESFAWASRSMLVMKASGRPWKPKKDRIGRDLGIWEIGAGVLAQD